MVNRSVTILGPLDSSGDFETAIISGPSFDVAPMRPRSQPQTVFYFRPGVRARNALKVNHQLISNRSDDFRRNPCFGGSVTTNYMMSIVKLMQHADAHNFSISLNVLANDSLITRARNTLVAHFMTMPEATHLMFIDADIGFEPELVHRMQTFDQDVVGGMYPARALRWNPPPKIVERERPQTATLNYVGQFCRALS